MDRKNASTVAILLFTIVLAVPLVTMTLFKDGLYYPHLVVNTSGTVDTDFLVPGRRGKANCERVLDNMAHAIASVCPECVVKQRQCFSSLNPKQRRILSSEPLDVPSSRLSDAVVTYRSADAKLALLACTESESQSAMYPNARLKCYKPFAVRSWTAMTAIDTAGFLAASLFLLVSAIVAWTGCYLLIQFQSLHAHVSSDHTSGGPQKFHAIATPRVGGLAVLAGILTTGIGLLPVEHRFSAEEYAYFVLASLPAFAGGFAEDITKRVGVITRLSFTMIAAFLGAWLISAVLRKIDVPLFDHLLLWTPFAVAFTVFAVSGVANSINIIDGYNGLVSGYSMLVLAAIAWVATQVGDMFVFTAAMSMLGALLGFFVWNYPRGRIFLGDGGAYLLGFWLAELSVLLVARHPTVSPWFPLVLLLYPVFETVFSIYRRKVYRGSDPGQPDALHFHQLVYMRLVRLAVGSRDARLLTHRNSAVAAYVWCGTLLFIVPATFVWDKTAGLVAIAAAFCVAYVWLYGRLVHWRAPRWLIRLKRS